MKIYIASAGDELNLLCFRFYGTIQTEVLSEFYQANHELLLKPILGGEIVYIPKIKKPKPKTQEQLWD